MFIMKHYLLTVMLSSTILLLLAVPTLQAPATDESSILRFKPESKNIDRTGYVGNKISSWTHSLKVKSSSFVTCEACKLGIGLLQKALERNTSFDSIKSDVVGICKLFRIETPDVCEGVTNMFAPELLTVMSELKVTSGQMCWILMGGQCGDPYDPWVMWNISLSNKPQPVPISPKLPKPGSPKLRVLHLTDVHFDARYKPGANAKCKKPLCCRAESGDVESPEDAAWLFGDYRSCDTPLKTLDNLLSHLAKDKYDYIIWTGDLPAHDIWEQPRGRQLASLHTIVEMILKYFPHTPVYPSLGNHEGSPVNSFPPDYIKGNNSISWLYTALAASWSHWLPKEALSTVIKGAYYTVSPKPGLRLVSLNMNYCNNQNWWMLLNATDPNQELEWLVRTLQAAEDAGEKVHILGHIPPGIDDCLKAWSWNYYKIISRYQNTVMGQFFGHTHYDSFTMFYDVETLTRPVSVAYVAPSVTPYSGLNMGYRIYDVDGVYSGSSYQILDHHTYILDLAKAHKQGNITWEHEYSAKAAYNMTSLLPESWHKLAMTMKANPGRLQQYNRYYHKSVDAGACDSACHQSRLCEVLAGRSYDPALCREVGVMHHGHLMAMHARRKRHC